MAATARLEVRLHADAKARLERLPNSSTFP